MEMSGSGNGRDWRIGRGNGSLLEEEKEDAVEQDCLFKEFYYGGCTPGDQEQWTPVSIKYACGEGSPGWEGGVPADYCWESGNGHCHKGYGCQCKHLFNDDCN